MGSDKKRGKGTKSRVVGGGVLAAVAAGLLGFGDDLLRVAGRAVGRASDDAAGLVGRGVADDAGRIGIFADDVSRGGANFYDEAARFSKRSNDAGQEASSLGRWAAEEAATNFLQNLATPRSDGGTSRLDDTVYQIQGRQPPGRSRTPLGSSSGLGVPQIPRPSTPKAVRPTGKPRFQPPSPNQFRLPGQSGFRAPTPPGIRTP